MSVNAVQFGNIYSVNAIQRAQSRYNHTTAEAVKDRELHPKVSSDLAETSAANKLDFLC